MSKSGSTNVRYKYCIVPKCTNTTITAPNKVFLSIPKGEKLRKKWCDAMKRDSKTNTVLSSTSNRFCCEDHFKLENDLENYMEWKLMGGNCRLKKEVVPHIFKCQLSSIIKPERNNAPKRPRNDILQTLETPVDVQVSISTQIEWVDCGNTDVKFNPLESSNGEEIPIGNISSVKSKKVQVKVRDFCHSKKTQTDNTTTMFIPSKEKGNVDPETSSNWEYSSRSQKEYTEYMLKGTMMSIEREPKFLVGIPKESYFCLQVLSQKIPVPHINILITLKKIRLNEPSSILAMQFGRSSVNIGQIFKRTVPLLSKYLKELILWPAANKIAERLPIAFRSRYSKVQSIIGCFKIRIQKPSNPLHESLTWSEYKRCNTIKYMVSCTPDGLVNFISCGFGGRTSDDIIFENCGYTSNLSPGMEIMTDKGFKNVSTKLATYGCVLIRPPSVSASTFISKDEILESKRLASLRIHVDRVIGRLREFNMLLPHVRVDLKYLSIFDDVVVIVCGLINLQNQLTKF
ncbi:uncharacterized protein LOC130444923 isoform X1 [Diorhabda sublineata]|uniref:uncharacterized protein LOC130444923 isoform X1 n=2 Tax=Diorhabda sublineata TaxID=1163346 RepID=UPI0024E09467|nr:uncharacterized protein LOC130444923 isoform X1 [Diorhabda sublineata]